MFCWRMAGLFGWRTLYCVLMLPLRFLLHVPSKTFHDTLSGAPPGASRGVWPAGAPGRSPWKVLDREGDGHHCPPKVHPARPADMGAYGGLSIQRGGSKGPRRWGLTCLFQVRYSPWASSFPRASIPSSPSVCDVRAFVLYKCSSEVCWRVSVTAGRRPEELYWHEGGACGAQSGYCVHCWALPNGDPTR